MNSVDCYRAADYQRMVRCLHNWRVRHPIRHMVEPLPDDMVTHTSDVLLTNYEATRQAIWNGEYWEDMG